jgi:hypothetical protein
MLGETALSAPLRKFEYEEFTLILRLTKNGLSYVTLFKDTSSHFELKDDWLPPVRTELLHADMRVLDDTLPGLESYIMLAHRTEERKY